MPSQTKSVRGAQKDRYESAIAARVALLKEKGLAPAAIQKDARLRHLRAGLRQTMTRLQAIAATEKQNEALALKKRQAELGVKEEKSAKPEPQPKAAKKEKKEKKTKPKASE
ncbi:MAG: hypothetical protein AB1640_12770 [bacterium]